MTPYIIKEKNVTRWDKLLSRILSMDKDVRFEELRRVLEHYGYEMNVPSGGSSHYTFRKQGRSPITIPRHKTIKKVYVEMVRQVIEEENKDEDSRVL